MDHLLRSREGIFRWACVSAIGCTFGASGCASSVEGTTVRLTHSAFLMESEGSSREVKANEPLPLKGKPLFFERKGKRSVLLVPVRNDDGDVRVTLPGQATVEDAAANPTTEDLRKKILAEYQAFLPRFFESQVLKDRGLNEAALESMTLLRADFPDVTYAGFFMADLLHSLGRSREAEQALSDALRDFPRDARGLRLKARIQATLREEEKKPERGSAE